MQITQEPFRKEVEKAVAKDILETSEDIPAVAGPPSRHDGSERSEDEGAARKKRKEEKRKAKEMRRESKRARRKVAFQTSSTCCIWGSPCQLWNIQSPFIRDDCL